MAVTRLLGGYSSVKKLSCIHVFSCTTLQTIRVQKKKKSLQSLMPRHVVSLVMKGCGDMARVHMHTTFTSTIVKHQMEWMAILSRNSVVFVSLVALHHKRLRTVVECRC